MSVARPPSLWAAPRVVALLAALALSAALAYGMGRPSRPKNCRAIPDYADDTIIVAWDDVSGETGYRVFRAEEGSGVFEQVGPDIPADTTTTTDAVPDPSKDYSYKVRAFDESGESDDSNVFVQNVKVVWPYPGHHALLHNWNETIGAAGSGGQGYHKGVDHQQQVGGPQGEIVFPRGGVVARVGNQGHDNNHVFVEVKIGPVLRYDSFNHLDGSNLGFDVGDHVRAGQVIGKIGDDYFTDGSLDWIDHVHFFVPSDPFTGEADGEHPLKIFREDAERDPEQVRPRIFDHEGDGTVLYHRQGSPPGPPYLTLPLGDDPATGDDEGNVDVHVEIADDMNGGIGTTLVPTSVAYWIEGRECDSNPPAVADAASPYTLLRWDHRFFRDEGVNWRDLVDEAQDLADGITHDGVDYPSSWENFKHFIVTNTRGTDGEPGNVDASQYWNTNARDDGSPPTVSHANFAGREDASMAEEARFPDGEYAIHVVSVDLLGSRAETVQGVGVENFPPAVADRFVDRGIPPGGTGNEDVDFYRLDFSEPMDRASVEAAIRFDLVGGGAVPHSAVWSDAGCTVSLVPDPPLDPTDEFEVAVDADLAADPAGRLLDAEFGDPDHDGTSDGSPADDVSGACTFTPLPEVAGVAVERIDPATARISWPAVGEADTYSVTRGELSSLSAGAYGDCLATRVATPSVDDPDVPAAGAGYSYLVQIDSDACGVGTLGADSGAEERINGDPDACH